MILHGIDISKWQTADTAKRYIKSQDFIILRAGYGKNNKDKMFDKHYNRCMIENKPYGVYWFSYATSVEDAINEARYCWNICMENPVKPLYPIYFDLEYDSQSYFKKQTGKKMSKDDVLNFTKAFCNEIERLGGYAGYYCNKDYYNRYYKDLKQYTCWLADYSNSSFENRPSHIHMIQTGSKPIDTDICKVDFPDVIINNKLNGYK